MKETTVKNRRKYQTEKKYMSVSLKKNNKNYVIKKNYEYL